MDYSYLRYIYELLNKFYNDWKSWSSSIDLSVFVSRLDRISFFTEALLVVLIVYVFGRIYRGK